MKLANWVCCAAISLGLASSATWSQEPAAPADTDAAYITVAEHAVSIEAPGFFENAGSVLAPAHLNWAPTELPGRWTRARDTTEDSASGGNYINWVRVMVPLASVPSSGVSIYLPTADAARVVVYANGVRVAESPAYLHQPGRFAWLFEIPATSLHGGSNDITLALPPWRNWSSTLSRVEVGSAEAVRPHWLARNWWLRVGPQVVCLTVAIAGTLMFGVWLGRRQEMAYLYYSLSAAIWTLRSIPTFFDRLPIDSDWFWWAVLNTLPWLMTLIFLFALRVHGKRYPRLEAALFATAIGLSLATLPGITSNIWGFYSFVYNGQFAIALGVTLLITYLAWTQRNAASVSLTVALWICLAFGLNDLAAQTNYRYRDFEGFYLLPYGALVLFASLSIGAIQRFLRSLSEVEALNRSLEQRVREKVAELEMTYRQLAIVERERAASDERSRLMREMHDGLGSSLMTSLKMVERGRLGSEEVATVLRECIDDLRLIIDSLEPIDHDLVALLATLRYRLGHRLEAAGIRFEWQVGDIPPLDWLDQTSALQIMRALQEVLTNCLKHADADRIWVETGERDGRVFVRVCDDGRGFDVPAQLNQGTGRGLRNLMRRAESIKGELDIASGPSGTVITLLLPIQGAREAVSPAMPMLAPLGAVV